MPMQVGPKLLREPLVAMFKIVNVAKEGIARRATDHYPYRSGQTENQRQQEQQRHMPHEACRKGKGLWLTGMLVVSSVA